MRRPPPHIACLLALVGLVSLSGCVGPLRHVYPGEPRPESEVGVLSDGLSATVYAIDGERVDGSRFAVLPGWHSVWLRVKYVTQSTNMVWTVWTFCEVSIDAIAGEAYEANVEIRKETASGLREKVTNVIQILDASKRPRWRAGSCASDAPDLASLPPLFDMLLAGSWGWSRGGNMPGCNEKPHTFTLSDGGRMLDLRYGDDEPTPHLILRRKPASVRVRDVATKHTNDAGEPFEWDLIRLSPRAYCWRRMDWAANACTQKIVRCDD